MASLFETADHDSNPSSEFWKQPDEHAILDCETKKVKSGLVKFFDSSGKIKEKILVLTPGKLYTCKENKPARMAEIYWKRLEAFSEENAEDQRYGFRLVQRGVFQDFYVKTAQELESWIDCLSSFVILTDLEEDFTVIKEIGSGNYGKVYLAHDCQDQKEFAVKSICKQAIVASARSTVALISEIKIMRRLSHPALIKLHRVYETAEHVHLILDYVQGGDLFQRIQHKSCYSEADAAQFMRSLLEALDYIHSHNYIHRDLKPENILLVRQEDDVKFKIADFGLACECREDQVQRCGSPGYVAPEILKKRNYGKKCDVFSAGIILYILLSYRAPFFGKSTNEILVRNKECKIYFQDKYWKHVSREGIDCVLRLTDPDPESRPTAREALKHPWLSLANACKVKNSAVYASPALRTEKDSGISAELMRRMNRARGGEVVAARGETVKGVSEEQRNAVNQNAKNLLSKLRAFDTGLKG